MNEETPKIRIGVARTLARNLLKKAKIKEPPTSLRVVIKYLQEKYNLAIFSNPTLNNNMSGMLVRIDNELLDEQSGGYSEIHYNAKHSWHRNRFTIAHEIGHLILETSCDKSFLSFDTVSNPIEIEANQFAAELLMPVAAVKKDLKTPGVKIPELAWKYIVSQEALGWKISSCL
jgi:hypothetical protein